MLLRVWIPLPAPGKNARYGYRYSTKKQRVIVYQATKADQWAEQAALIIGNKAGQCGWHDDSPWYGLTLWHTNLRLDCDAPVSLTVDTLFRKIGVDDKRLTELHVFRVKSRLKGVLLILEPSLVQKLPEDVEDGYIQMRKD